MLTILPRRWEIMNGTTARVMLNVPVTLVSSTALHVLVLQGGQRIVADHAGVVDQQINAAGAVNNLLDERRAGRGIAHVHGFGGNLCAGIRGA